MNSVFIEAESFEKLGGWVVDQQSMEQMGSAYLMAHGYGVPVEDAVTGFSLKNCGKYTVWVRTRDWTAVWGRGTPAGRFQIAVDGELLKTELGTNGPAWSWQKAGSIEMSGGAHTVALHDLTGFNGRCDAIYFTDDGDFVPPDSGKELADFRERETGNTVINSDEQFDLIVVGGGIAGECLAISAMRAGCRILLLHDRSVLGGCNSSEIRISVGGRIHDGPYPAIGNVVKNITPMYSTHETLSAEWYEDHRKLSAFDNCDWSKRKYKVMLGEKVTAVEMRGDGKGIAAVIATNIYTGKRVRYSAPLFADATGDGTIARLAGARLMYGRESRETYKETLAPVKGDRQVMGHSVLWYSKPAAEESPFPDIDWGIPFNDENCYYIRGGDWEQETGQYRDMVNEIEYIRDYGLLAIYSNWSFLKNRSKRKAEFSHDKIEWVSPIGGKRESYRVVGDYVLTQNDIEDFVEHEDGTAVMSWSIDLHYPEPDNEDRFGEAFRSCAYHRGIVRCYPVPYRCLYAKDVDNLFLAGRDISVSHVAFSSVRVMRTLGCLGEVAGMAAGICKKHGAKPADVYAEYLDELKEAMKDGVVVPELFVCGPGAEESYHFKDIGWFRINPEFSYDGDGDSEVLNKFVRNIRRLGMTHKYNVPDVIKDLNNQKE